MSIHRMNPGIPAEVEDCINSLAISLFNLIKKSKLSREETLSGVKAILQGVYLLGFLHVRTFK